jgi:pimeloyl-ACP methyl ester carboxylesterase
MDHVQGAGTVRLRTGVRVCYDSTGPPTSSQVPVLLLHAWAESRRSFDRLIPLLPGTLRVIALDQRGHGDADKPAAGYELDDFAADIEAFMDEIGLPSAVLVGSSSGGYVAQQVAIRCPSRVAGLGLIGSPRTLRGRPPFADELDELPDPIDPDWVRQTLAWFPRSRAVPLSYVEDRVRDGARIPARVWRDVFNGLITAQPPTEVATIAAPTLIIWGEHDELLTRDQQQELAAAIPASRLVVYEDTGHLVLWEQPERLASDLSAFIETLDGSPG